MAFHLCMKRACLLRSKLRVKDFSQDSHWWLHVLFALVFLVDGLALSLLWWSSLSILQQHTYATDETAGIAYSNNDHYQNHQNLTGWPWCVVVSDTPTLMGFESAKYNIQYHSRVSLINPRVHRG